MADVLTQAIGAAVGGGATAGAIIMALAKMVVRQLELRRAEDLRVIQERFERNEDEIKRLRERLHDLSNRFAELQLELGRKNGAEVRALDQRLSRIEVRQDNDHGRIGGVEDQLIKLEARFSK